MNELDLFKADTQTFIKELGGPNQSKMADAAGLFIAEKLRERSFARQILTPRQVTRYDLQADVDHDQLYFLDEKEVATAPAMAINFKAEPDDQYITTPRYKIYIGEISSKLYAKKEIELLASSQPVTKIIEDNTVREIEEVEDSYFLKYADSAAKIALGGSNLITYAGGGGQLTKGALKALINRIARNRLKCSTVLMSDITFNDFLTMTYQDLGSDLLKEVTVEGYKYYNFGGFKLIVSIKDSMFLANGFNSDPAPVVLASGDFARYIYGFTEEKALGRFLVLDQTKFYMRRVFTVLEWLAAEFMGIGIGNANGIARCTILD